MAYKETTTKLVSPWRKDFPLLNKEVNNSPLVYFDSAATSQKPKSLIDALKKYYDAQNSNVHRGAHTLANEATEVFEQTRKKLANYFNITDSNCFVYTKGTTEAINLVAQSFGSLLKEGDEIIVGGLEHHANFVPWQELGIRKNLKVHYLDFDLDSGLYDLEMLANLLSSKTALLAITHVSNALGVVQDVKAAIQMAHQAGAKVLIDGAQAVPHLAIDLKMLDPDFYVFSGHKMFAPTGTGVLYGKMEMLNAMPPYQFGGEMIAEVSRNGTSYNQVPFRFEAGTPNIAGVIGLAVAIDYLEGIASEAFAWEEELLQYLTTSLQSIPGLTIYGHHSEKVPTVSFNIDGIHAYDLGVLLDQQGIAIRTGHHCCQPLMQSLEVEGTCRASLSFYNDKGEIDKLVLAINKALKILS